MTNIHYLILMFHSFCAIIHIVFLKMIYGNVIYISGPISSRLDTYKSDFEISIVGLRRYLKKTCPNRRFAIYSPSRNWYPNFFGITSTGVWVYCMGLCYSVMPFCTHIYMLNGWKKSKGASLEHNYFLAAKENVLYEKECLAAEKKDVSIERLVE